MKKGVQSVLFSVLVGALLLCAGCGKSGDIYTAGVYTASAEGYSGPVTVEVEFDGSSILSVHVLSHSETVNISDRAIDELPSRIVEAQTWDVDAVSSATFTSDAIDGRIRQITEALEAEVIPFPGSGMSLGDIDRRLAELEAQFQRLLEKAADDPIAYGDQFKEILDEQTSLKELRATILAESREHAEADRRIKDAAGMLENAVSHITEWDETAIRQLVAQVKVLSKNEISVTLKSGIEIRQSISN